MLILIALAVSCVMFELILARVYSLLRPLYCCVGFSDGEQQYHQYSLFIWLWHYEKKTLSSIVRETHDSLKLYFAE